MFGLRFGTFISPILCSGCGAVSWSESEVFDAERKSSEEAEVESQPAGVGRSDGSKGTVSELSNFAPERVDLCGKSAIFARKLSTERETERKKREGVRRRSKEKERERQSERTEQE